MVLAILTTFGCRPGDAEKKGTLKITSPSVSREETTTQPAATIADQAPAKEPAAEATKEPAKDPVKEPAAETVKELPAETAKEPAKEAPKEPVKEAAKEPAAEPVKDAAAPADPNTLTLELTVKWLPKPTDNPDSVAADQASMKPYSEKLLPSDVTFDMVPIPGGTYKMGSPASEKERKDDEGPQVEVKIEPFWMEKCEVSWQEYELWGLGIDKQRRPTDGSATQWDKTADVLANPTKPYSDMSFGMGKQGYPAICMTQFAAKMYCKWLSAKTGRYYRLPTEAEWEYACRAGTNTAYSFGDDPEKLGDFAWSADNADEKYHKIGQKKPNGWGLYDMHGNVAEWCLDQYVADRYAQLAPGPVDNPMVTVTAEYPQVVRGGAWTDEAPLLRSAARRGSNKDWKAQDPQIPQSIWYHTDANFVGFRVVRPLRVPTAEEAVRYDITQYEKDEFLDYQKAQAGKE